jgi:hypothetical protein
MSCYNCVVLFPERTFHVYYIMLYQLIFLVKRKINFHPWIQHWSNAHIVPYSNLAACFWEDSLHAYHIQYFIWLWFEEEVWQEMFHVGLCVLREGLSTGQ